MTSRFTYRAARMMLDFCLAPLSKTTYIPGLSTLCHLSCMFLVQLFISFLAVHRQLTWVSYRFYQRFSWTSTVEWLAIEEFSNIVLSYLRPSISFRAWSILDANHYRRLRYTNSRPLLSEALSHKLFPTVLQRSICSSHSLSQWQMSKRPLRQRAVSSNREMPYPYAKIHT